MKLSDLIHVIAGLFTSFLVNINPLLSIFIFTSFMIYEIIQDIHVHDVSIINDILEYTIGLGIGSLIHMYVWIMDKFIYM